MFDHNLSFHDDVLVLESISVPGETVVEKHNDLSLFTQMDNSGTSNFSIVKMETSSNTGDNEYYLCSDHHRPRDSYAFDIMKTIMNPKKMGIVRIVKTPQQRLKAKKNRKGPRPWSSQYRGVIFYSRNGRWESHIGLVINDHHL
ncbi:hypothetical protein CQW23_24485 [Capsicum baccatum]|uniref:Uncharacterized protein n=1 Tax=Capsicum baccatum TaxID=33114 RepID=A0A2G2VUY5_CAPBA|nr:hypothetical protein CQW23_24485 [Capsicum baccatum]